MKSSDEGIGGEQRWFRRICRSRPLLVFGAGVAVISGVFFALTQLVPGAGSPEEFPGLLIWLPLVWSPTLAALAVTAARGEAGALLGRFARWRMSGWAWLGIATPLLVSAAAIALAGHGAHWERLTLPNLLLLTAINLILGPLGEEAGWRGFLQPRLDARLGPARAALLIAAAWALWHLPLWAVDSPHAQIPYGLFAAHVLCYSFLMSALVRGGGGSLIPAVGVHLLVNVTLGAVLVVELTSAGRWFAWTLPGYALVAALAWAAAAPRRGPLWRAAAGIAGAGVVGSALAVALAPAKVPPVRDERGRPVPGQVAAIEMPEIGGVPQAVILRGRDARLPLVLFVHGGPGTPETPMLLDLIPALADHVIVAAWEQRGAGKSLSSHVPPESLTIAQMVRDLEEVSAWLLDRFDRDRLILMGHSWGTIPAMHGLARTPERYAAYVGIGQIGDPAEGERLLHEWLVAEARQRGDRRALADLAAIGPPRKGDYDGGYRARARLGRWITRWGGAIAGRSDLRPYVRAVLTTPVYSAREKLDYLRGERFSLPLLWDEMQSHDLGVEVPRVEVPVFLFHGRHDRQTPLMTARAYLEALEAPSKTLFVFEDSAHSPIYEEPGRFLERFVRDVLPAADERGGPPAPTEAPADHGVAAPSPTERPTSIVRPGPGS
jgi:proline iminopeptidase